MTETITIDAKVTAIERPMHDLVSADVTVWLDDGAGDGTGHGAPFASPYICPAVCALLLSVGDFIRATCIEGIDTSTIVAVEKEVTFD